MFNIYINLSKIDQNYMFLGIKIDKSFINKAL